MNLEICISNVQLKQKIYNEIEFEMRKFIYTIVMIACKNRFRGKKLPVLFTNTQPITIICIIITKKKLSIRVFSFFLCKSEYFL